MSQNQSQPTKYTYIVINSRYISTLPHVAGAFDNEIDANAYCKELNSNTDNYYVCDPSDKYNVMKTPINQRLAPKRDNTGRSILIIHDDNPYSGLIRTIYNMDLKDRFVSQQLNK